MTIIIDAGHGDNTAGKCSPAWADGSQLFEYDFNRDIAARLCAELKTLNIDVRVLVPVQTDMPLYERVKRANAIAKEKGKDNCLVISIHANAGCGTGWEAFTSKGITKSDYYADHFYNSAVKYLPKQFPVRINHGYAFKNKEADFYILKNTVCPAVLTENLFMDTEKDCRYIMSDEGRKVITQIHVEAIKKCIKDWRESRK